MSFWKDTPARRGSAGILVGIPPGTLINFTLANIQAGHEGIYQGREGSYALFQPQNGPGLYRIEIRDIVAVRIP